MSLENTIIDFAKRLTGRKLSDKDMERAKGEEVVENNLFEGWGFKSVTEYSMVGDYYIVVKDEYSFRETSDVSNPSIKLKGFYLDGTILSVYNQHGLLVSKDTWPAVLTTFPGKHQKTEYSPHGSFLGKRVE
jgi:hypothetical protein